MWIVQPVAPRRPLAEPGAVAGNPESALAFPTPARPALAQIVAPGGGRDGAADTLAQSAMIARWAVLQMISRDRRPQANLGPAAAGGGSDHVTRPPLFLSGDFDAAEPGRS